MPILSLVDSLSYRTKLAGSENQVLTQDRLCKSVPPFADEEAANFSLWMLLADD
jgi:hypothetical protein